MPVAIVAGVAAALIVLLAAGAALSVQWSMQTAASGTRNVGNWVRGWAIVGGALGGALNWVADQFSGWAVYYAGTVAAKSWQAASWIANTTAWIIDNAPTYVHGAAIFGYNNANWAVSMIQNWIAPWLQQVSNGVGQLFTQVYNLMWPRIFAVENNFNQINATVWNWIAPRLSAVEANFNWLTQLVGQLQGQIAALGGRVLGLEQQIARETQQVIPRIQADVNARALERDLVALRDRVVANERAIAVLWTLAVLAAAGADVIDEVIRIGRDPCGVCVGLDLSDMEGRVAALEVNSG